MRAVVGTRELRKLLKDRGCEVRGAEGAHESWAAPGGRTFTLKAKTKDQAPGTLSAIDAYLALERGGHGAGGQVAKRYTVRCEWDEAGWWVVTVPELPGALTQSRRLDQVQVDVAEVVRLVTGQSVGYELDVDAHFPGSAGREAARAAALRAESDRLAHEAKDAAAGAVGALRAAGLTFRDIGTLVGVSYQRAQQLSEEEPSAPSSSSRARS